MSDEPCRIETQQPNFCKDCGRDLANKLTLEQWGYPQFNTVINTFKQYYERILNFFDNKLTNASEEFFNAKFKKS